MDKTAIDEANAADEKRWAALTSQDYDTVAGLLHDRLMYTHSNALFDTKDSLMTNLRNGTFAYRSVERGNLQFSEHGGTVFIAGIARIGAAFKGSPLMIHMRFSNAWVKGPQGWQMALWHSVPMPV